MSAHLLSLTALYAAAPGVLDVVFGPDGDFEGAPRWAPTLRINNRAWLGYEHHHDGVIWTGGGACWTVEECALDCRIPSVAARLAGLCKSADGRVDDDTDGDGVYSRRMYWQHIVASPAHLASLTLALAPRIAALRGSR